MTSTLERLSAAQISHYLSDYADAIASKPLSSTQLRGESLVELDAWYQSLPTLTCPSDLSCGLAGKADLVKLMQWKLSREKFRPTLLSLIRSNPPEVCEEVLRRAADNLLSNPPTPISPEGCLSAVEGTMRILAELRGVGPATSSAIVAAWSPLGVFQSDELATAVLGQGTKVEYTWAFYKRFYRKAWEVMKKMEVSGREVERVAWSMAYGPAATEGGRAARSETGVGKEAGGVMGKGKKGPVKDEERANGKDKKAAMGKGEESQGDGKRKSEDDTKAKRKRKVTKPSAEVKEEPEASRRTSKRLRSQ